MECEFSDIVNLETDPEKPAQWSFSKFTCTASTTEAELIQNATSGAKFWLDKSINYGEILIIVFLSIFAIAIVCKWVSEFVFKD